MDDCRCFVEHLMQVALECNSWTQGPDLIQRRKAGVRITDRFVPHNHPAHILMGSWLLPRDRVLPSGTTGLKPEFVAGGQEIEAYRHIAAAAAAVLQGMPFLIDLQNSLDMQELRRAEPNSTEVLERQAELAGNEAGRKVGQAMTAYLNEEMTAAQLRITLTDILCTPTNLIRPMDEREDT